jgi:general stress protein YciG
MPIGNNSYLSGISEPGYTRSYGRQADDLPAILAKEPDRQSATRRGNAARNRMDEDYEERSEPRSRSQRTAQARRGGAQARRSTTTSTSRQRKSRRGFAAMSPEQQREIARKGGLTVSRNRRHMADIGRVGGEHSHGGRRTRARR